MKTYELTYIISPETTSEEVEAKIKEIESAISSREGTILKQSNPLPKTLSYQIKKHASGFFGFFEFQLEPEKLLELKEILIKDGKIVRHMLIIKEAAELKKERRVRGTIRPKPTSFVIEQKTENKEIPEPAFNKGPAVKEKVELKDIEHELEEILGE